MSVNASQYSNFLHLKDQCIMHDLPNESGKYYFVIVFKLFLLFIAFQIECVGHEYQIELVINDHNWKQNCETWNLLSFMRAISVTKTSSKVGLTKRACTRKCVTEQWDTIWSIRFGG